jgi:membrane protein DedA with SNARE-associated domain
MLFISLMAATLVSEDLACITTGLLIHNGRIGAVEGVAACTLGIFLGDLGLWAVGRIGAKTSARWMPAVHRARALRAHSIAGRIEARARDWFRRFPRDGMHRWLEQNAAGAIVASRFVPGARLPMHLCAGLFGVPLRVYGLWTFIAVLLWTPPFVLATAAIGSAAGYPLATVTGGRWWISQLIVAAALLLMLHALRPRLVSGFGRTRLRQYMASGVTRSRVHQDVVSGFSRTW